MKTLDIETLAARFRRCLPPQLRDCGDDQRLRDLALDSIDTVDLLCAVHEEFDVRLAEEDFNPDLTIRDLILNLARS
jgi:acyl carrier protein